jgi:uncharacterized membrane protein (UPF0127 family)
MKGLLDSAVCERGEVLALLPCRSIHTFGMRCAIDVAFIDWQGRVLKAARNVAPNRMLSRKGALCVLERRSTPAAPWFSEGDTLKLAGPRVEECQG